MPRVLILEDSPTQAKVLQFLLESEGFEVTAAPDGRAGLRLHLEQSFDLVVSDVVMPHMTGYEFCRAAKRDPRRREVPVVLLTSLSEPLDIVEGLQCGADNFITKPYEPSYLITRLWTILANRRRRAEATRPLTAVDVDFMGHRLSVAPENEQILDLLLAAFEQMARKNKELEAQRAELGEKAEELARLNVDLSRARDHAERESHFKSRFLASMSHELRTPLNSIIGFSELLEQEIPGPLRSKQKEYVDNVLGSGRHLLNLVNEILDLSKIEAGKMNLQPEWTSLQVIAGEVRDSLGPLAQKAGVTLSLAIAGGLPDLYVDPMRLKEILINLTSNAIKFTPTGGQITITGGRAGDKIEVAVRDSGVGIAPDDLDRLFREFEQIHTALPTKPQGTGLGLVLVKKLAEIHGGTVGVTSEPGKGSTFTVSFPDLRRGLAPRAGIADPGAAEAVAAPQVLIVDDDPRAAELIGTHLRGAGLSVAFASTADQAVRLAALLQPQAITLDILMPDGSGWSVLERLKQEPKTAAVPVVIISVVDEPQRGLMLGAAHCLVKPISGEALVSSLTALGLTVKRIAGAPVLLAGPDDEHNREIEAMLRQAGCALARCESLATVKDASLSGPAVLVVDTSSGDHSWRELSAFLDGHPALVASVVAITGPEAPVSNGHRQHIVRLTRGDALRGESLVRVVHEGIASVRR